MAVVATGCGEPGTQAINSDGTSALDTNDGAFIEQPQESLTEQITRFEQQVEASTDPKACSESVDSLKSIQELVELSNTKTQELLDSGQFHAKYLTIGLSRIMEYSELKEIIPQETIKGIRARYERYTAGNALTNIVMDEKGDGDSLYQQVIDKVGRLANEHDLEANEHEESRNLQEEAADRQTIRENATNGSVPLSGLAVLADDAEEVLAALQREGLVFVIQPAEHTIQLPAIMDDASIRNIEESCES